MARIFVVDGNWYLHRCFFTLKSSRPMEDVLPENFLSLVLKDACAVKASHLLVAFDGHAIFRYKVYPEYKANRTEKKGSGDEEPERNIYSCLPNLRELMARCGIAFIQKKQYEADDVWASAADQYSALGHEVIGGSKDKDGYQVLGPKVRLYDSTAKPNPRFITEEKAEKHKGVKVSQMVMFQTLIGDPIDNIPQILTPGEAKKVIKTWGTIKAWFAKADPKTKRWLRANQVKLSINRQLVELKRDLSLPEVEALKVAKASLKDMPKSWYVYQDFVWPKTKGLFGNRK